MRLRENKFHSQTLAVAIGLFPIGILFGVLAQPNDWSWSDVLLLSIFGFSASGQFFYLKLSNEQASLSSIFFVILMLNIRYIPMALTAWNSKDKKRKLLRLASSHFISDESFAIESISAPISLRLLVRIIIFSTWVLSTVLGVIVAKYIPLTWLSSQYLLFPASAILVILAVKRLDRAVMSNTQFSMAKKMFFLSVCGAFSAIVLLIIGKDAFWIPGIAGVSALLYFSGWKNAHD